MEGEKNGIFSIKASFALMECGNLKVVPLKVIWTNCVPIKVCFFAWEVWRGKVLTLEQLKKRAFNWQPHALCVEMQKKT